MSLTAVFIQNVLILTVLHTQTAPNSTLPLVLSTEPTEFEVDRMNGSRDV